MSDAQIFKKPFTGMESGHIVNQLTYLEDEKVKEDAKKDVKEEVKEPVANALEILPINFIREGWVICPICLEEIDIKNYRYLLRISECGHIMHLLCFKRYKKYFLNKAENSDKTCCPCPSCRGKCCY